MAAAASPSAGRLKYGTILLAVVASGLVLSASTQTWYSLQLTAAAAHSGTVTVTGSVAGPAIAALSLAGVAFAAALALAGRVLRFVLALLGLVLAASIIGSTASAMADPVSAGISSVTKATGIAGDHSVRVIVAHVDVTAWPALALVGGILLAVAALAVAATAHLWPATSRRYGAALDASAAGHDESHDGLPAADVRARARDAAIDDWDELSRGDDPTDHGDEDDGTD